MALSPDINEREHQKFNPDGSIKSSSPNYTQRIDEASATVTYIGKAQIGSSTSESVWQIKKLDSTSGLVITWANGTDEFTNEWDERGALSYA